MSETTETEETFVPARELIKVSTTNVKYVDYKDSENLIRCLSVNGKINGRRKNGLTAKQQRMISQSIKRARHMGLLPFTSATM